MWSKCIVNIKVIQFSSIRLHLLRRVFVFDFRVSLLLNVFLCTRVHDEFNKGNASLLLCGTMAKKNWKMKRQLANERTEKKNSHNIALSFYLRNCREPFFIWSLSMCPVYYYRFFFLAEKTTECAKKMHKRKKRQSIFIRIDAHRWLRFINTNFIPRMSCSTTLNEYDSTTRFNSIRRTYAQFKCHGHRCALASNTLKPSFFLSPAVVFVFVG